MPVGMNKARGLTLWNVTYGVGIGIIHEQGFSCHIRGQRPIEGIHDRVEVIGALVGRKYHIDTRDMAVIAAVLGNSM